jgi:hypothetical protein
MVSFAWKEVVNPEPFAFNHMSDTLWSACHVAFDFQRPQVCQETSDFGHIGLGASS